MPLTDEATRDSPIGQLRQALLVRCPVLDLGHLVGHTELTPAHAVIPVKHKCRMGSACPNTSQFPLTVQSLLATVIGVEAHAPAAAKDAVIALHQTGKRLPGRFIESLDRVARPHRGAG